VDEVNEQAMQLGSRGEFPQALRIVRQALRGSPQPHRARVLHLQEGRLLVDMGQYKEAIQTLQQWAPPVHEDLDISLVYANALFMVGQSREAEVLLQRTLKAFPGQWQTLQALAETRLQHAILGENGMLRREVLDGAMALLSRVLEINPSSAATRLMRACVLIDRGDAASATAELEAVVGNQRVRNEIEDLDVSQQLETLVRGQDALRRREDSIQGQIDKLAIRFESEFMLADLYYRQNRLDAARATLENALRRTRSTLHRYPRFSTPALHNSLFDEALFLNRELDLASLSWMHSVVQKLSPKGYRWSLWDSMAYEGSARFARDCAAGNLAAARGDLKRLESIFRHRNENCITWEMVWREHNLAVLHVLSAQLAYATGHLREAAREYREAARSPATVWMVKLARSVATQREAKFTVPWLHLHRPSRASRQGARSPARYLLQTCTGRRETLQSWP